MARCKQSRGQTTEAGTDYYDVVLRHIVLIVLASFAPDYDELLESWSSGVLVSSANSITPLFQFPSLPPFIHRNRFLIIATHDTPVTVGFAAHYYDMNLVGLEHANHLVRRGF